MRLSLALPLLLVAALAAGCLSTNGAVNDAPDRAAAPTVRAASAPAPAPQAAALGPAPIVVPLAFDGKTPAYVEACAWSLVVGQCVDSPSDFSKIRYEPALNGTPTSMRVTITWAAASPAEQQMTIFAGSHAGNSYKYLGGKTGPSPLTLEFTKMDVPKGNQLYVGLAGTGSGGGAMVAGANGSGNPMDQPWKLAGEVTLAAS